MAVELRHLRYFLAVARELNFSRAAERLGMAQPPLSRQIGALEDELGVRLLTRATRRVELTDAGRSFRREAQSVVEQVDRAAAVARQVGRGEVRRLAVAVAPAADLGVIPMLVARFVRAHPEVSLELHGLPVADHLDALRSGVVQLVLMPLPVPDHHEVSAERFEQQRLGAIVSRTSRFARRRTLTVAALAGEPLVLLPRHLAPTLYDVVLVAFREAGLPFVVRHEAAHLHMAFGLVAAGLGVTLVPEGAASACSEGVVYRPLERGPTLDFALVYRRDDASPLLKAFLHDVRGRRGRRRR
jgi:DNA-binding transcriptional LysR family regulator